MLYLNEILLVLVCTEFHNPIHLSHFLHFLSPCFGLEVQENNWHANKDCALAKLRRKRGEKERNRDKEARKKREKREKGMPTRILLITGYRPQVYL